MPKDWIHLALFDYYSRKAPRAISLHIGNHRIAICLLIIAAVKRWEVVSSF
jgi:hypothetical protein